MGMIESRNDRTLYTAWFNGCIVQALRASHCIDVKAFSKQDIQALYDVCYMNSWANLKDAEAIQLLGLFKLIGQNSLEVAYTKLGDRDETAWLKILTEIYDLNKEISLICYAHKETMLTQALYRYSQRCHPPEGFYEIVARFQQMSYENLLTLGELVVSPMLEIFLELLP